MNKKYYYLYEIKIDNEKSSLNQKYYYGKHITSNLNDGYYGSGKIIKLYKEKYGIDGLQKTILSYYNNEIELNEAEKELIKNKKEILKDNCLNLIDGGHGSFTYINQNLTKEQKHKKAVAGGMANKKRLEDPRTAEEWKNKVKEIHKNMSPEEKINRYTKVSQSLKKYYATEEGQKRIRETKEKNRESNKKTAQEWRNKFKVIFNGASPESFRKYGKQKEAYELFKKIKDLNEKEQQQEVQKFLKLIEEIV